MTITVNEKTSSYLTVSFKNKAGVLDIPASIVYRIDCITNGIEILTDTVVVPASVVEIIIPSSLNSIINNTNEKERRRVTVKATYGVGIEDAINDFYDFDVLNLSGVS